jgi:5-(carboxyamino)imidazole ribonucleotide synthase
MSLTVGIVGGGQLARMMIAPAVELGVRVRVLAEEAGMSAELAASAVGDHRDLDTVLAFARDVDVVTFDHEHVPQEVLRALVAEGIAVHPGPDALQFAQDKLRMRARLAELGMPQPDWAAVSDAAGLQEFVDAHGGRAVVKTPRGGYDGKGVRVVESAAEAEDWLSALEPDGLLLVEELVDFTRELAQQIARRPSGQSVAYPVVETVQRGGVCAEVIAPAPHTGTRLPAVAAQIGTAIAEGLGVTGMLAVELFETSDERLLVNELAMRPHNSGHWSQDGAVTSQFEQHVRAVLDLPLGDATPRQQWSVMVNILGGPASDTLESRFPAALAAHPAVKVHTYGKAPRPGRKVGHVNAVGDELDAVVYEARAAADFFAD